jgi:hypothetical protein
VAQHRILLLIPYFGRWPEWMAFFVESCRRNAGVTWRLYTDCGEPENRAPNVEIVPTSFADYKARVRQRLGIAFDPGNPYKLCDLKPCLGAIHAEELDGYSHFGFGDIDVIFGDIGAVYDDALLSRYDVLSTHTERISGHFAVFRNTAEMREAFRRIPGVAGRLADLRQSMLDENEFTRVFQRPIGHPLDPPPLAIEPMACRALFEERHSTVLSPRRWHDGTMDYPRRWFWKDGRLTNERDGARQFLYLHFMRWKSDRWMQYPVTPGEGAWLTLPRVVAIDWRRAAAEGFCISPAGIGPLASANAGTS